MWGTKPRVFVEPEGFVRETEEWTPEEHVGKTGGSRM